MASHEQVDGDTDSALLAAAVTAMITNKAPRRTVTATAAAIVRTLRTVRRGTPTEEHVVTGEERKPKGTKHLTAEQRHRLRERRKRARAKKKTEKGKFGGTAAAAVSGQQSPAHPVHAPAGEAPATTTPVAKGESERATNDATMKDVVIEDCPSGFGSSSVLCLDGGRSQAAAPIAAAVPVSAPPVGASTPAAPVRPFPAGDYNNEGYPPLPFIISQIKKANRSDYMHEILVH